jgi:hypothetical protein
MPKGFGMRNALWPMPRVLLSMDSLLPFLLDLVHLGEQLAPPAMPLIKADALGLIGLE